jgi:hypothetical protein
MNNSTTVNPRCSRKRAARPLLAAVMNRLTIPRPSPMNRFSAADR